MRTDAVFELTPEQIEIVYPVLKQSEYEARAGKPGMVLCQIRQVAGEVRASVAYIEHDTALNLIGVASGRLDPDRAIAVAERERNEARARLAAVEAALSFLPKREWFMVQLRSIDDDWVLDGYVLVSAKREQWLTLLDALSASPAQQAAPDPVRELLISLSDGVLEMMEHEGIGRTNIEVIRRRRDDAARALGLGEQVEPDPRLRAYDHAAQWVIDTGECLFCDYEDGQHEDFCPLSGASPEPDSATQP